MKPDALSRQFPSAHRENNEMYIIPVSRIVAPIHWGNKTTVRQAQQQQPDPVAQDRPDCYIYLEQCNPRSSTSLPTLGLKELLSFCKYGFGGQVWGEMLSPLC